MKIGGQTYNSFINTITTGFTPVLDTFYSQNDYVPLDLSVSNTELIKIDVGSSDALEQYVNAQLIQKNGKVGYGGYIERRDIYSRSVYFNQNDISTQRNIHLGLDLWCAAGTKILAAYEGTIHSFKDNKNYGDYGPCIILSHKVENSQFYTLYGHLSRESIENIKPGQKFKCGETIATLGTSAVNGDYAPHLHFQLIMDIENNQGDYPGVCNDKDLHFYVQNCPDPNLLLKIY